MVFVELWRGSNLEATTEPTFYALDQQCIAQETKKTTIFLDETGLTQFQKYSVLAKSPFKILKQKGFISHLN